MLSIIFLYDDSTGFVLEGLDIEHSHEAMPGVIRTVTDLLPADKPRFIHGLHTPGNIHRRILRVACQVHSD